MRIEDVKLVVGRAERCEEILAPSPMAESRRIPSEAENPSGLRLGAAAPPPRGPIPDRFQIKEVVRSGAAVQTYKAYDRANRTWVLAKVVSGIQSGSTLLSQWRLHNDVVERLGHPAFVPAIEMGHSGDSIWLIMPFIAGKTLRQRLRSGRRIPSREAAALVAELAEALQLAHVCGLVHGNLKPEHILLANDGQTRLIDFGELPLRTMNSRPGSLAGTLAYMAPERIRTEVSITDTLSEVYALGVILYEAITGVAPFTGTVPELFAAIPKAEPKEPRRIVRSIPAALEGICLKAMAKDRSRTLPDGGRARPRTAGVSGCIQAHGFLEGEVDYSQRTSLGGRIPQCASPGHSSGEDTVSRSERRP